MSETRVRDTPDTVSKITIVSLTGHKGNRLLIIDLTVGPAHSDGVESVRHADIRRDRGKLGTGEDIPAIDIDIQSTA